MAKTQLRKRSPNPERLTDKQRAFCREYIVDYNGTRAAVAAGYSPRSPSAAAHKLLSNPLIQGTIGKMERHLIQKVGVEAEDVLQQLVYALKRDIRDFVDEEGQALNLADLNPRAAACVDGFKQKRYYNEAGELERIDTEVKLIPKAQILHMALQHKGLLSGVLGEERVRQVDWDTLLTQPETPENVIEIPNLLEMVEDDPTAVDGDVNPDLDITD